MKVNTEWAKLLQQANVTRADKVPAGFFPAEHWLEEFQISENTWKRRIPLLEEKGAFTRGHYRVIDRAGRVIRRPFWKRGK